MDCEHLFEVDTSIILASYPSKYGCQCRFCGKVEYIYCYELLDKLRTQKYVEVHSL